MKIKLKADISGSRNGVPWPRRGSTVDLPDAEAADLCKAGLAEPIAKKDAETVEKAVPPDDAEKRSEDGGPVTSNSAPAVAKKTSARTPAAKKAASEAPQGDSKN